MDTTKNRELKVLLYKEVEKANIKNVGKIAKQLCENGKLLMIYKEGDVSFQCSHDADESDDLAIILATMMSKNDDFKELIMLAIEYYDNNHELLEKTQEMKHYKGIKGK
jgi:hypothetical protein